MMIPTFACCVCVAVSAAAVAPVSDPEPGRSSPVVMEGGTLDDQALALAAAGYRQGEMVSEARLAVMLEAIRATDRFRSVTGSLLKGGARILLDPWPRLEGWTVQGQVKEVRQEMFRGLRKGLILGDQRLEQFRVKAEEMVRNAGYRKANISCWREDEDRRVRFEIEPGPPSRIQKMVLDGSAAPYSEASLLRQLKAEPGRTLWTSEFQREALSRIRKLFRGDKRYRAQVELTWSEDGLLRLRTDPGPVVRLAAEGSGLGMKSIKAMVPLERAERYSPELLEEGSRRILGRLWSQGYLDAKVEHQETLLSGTKERPTQVKITYRMEKGKRYRLRDIRLERNQEVGDAELVDALELDSLGGRLRRLFRSPLVTPELMKLIEGRIEAHYLSLGYSEISLRHLPMEVRDGKATLVYQVREGARRMLEGLDLEVPAVWDGAKLAGALPYALADDPVALDKDGRKLGVKVASRPAGALLAFYWGDRASSDGVLATLKEQSSDAGLIEGKPLPEKGAEEKSAGEKGIQDTAVRRYSLRFSKPMVFRKRDVAAVLSELQKRTAAIGAFRTQPLLKFETEKDRVVAVIVLPEQSLASVNRLVVRGASRTRAEAILRETRLDKGAALDPAALAGTQSGLAALGAFDRLELFSMRELGGGNAWGDGDLMLNLGERPPWNFSAGFGYDKSQGYHFDLGAQRTNLGGMGRVLDFGMRAGDATIRNPTLRKIFPTGEFTRSTDIYRIGYMDPWFVPKSIEKWLPEKTRLSGEAAYIEEQRNLYMLHRRRVLGGLEWRGASDILWQVGWRWERSDVDASPDSKLSEDVLALYAKIPRRSLLSGPFIQWVRDKRDNRIDPSRGTYAVLRVDFGNQLFGSSANASCVKVDFRQQWNWAMGERASKGVVSLGMRLGGVFPTGPNPEDLPLSERFFAGGPGTHRGIEPDALGVIAYLPPIGTKGPLPGKNVGHKPVRQTESLTVPVPVGGQGIALFNLEYRFPVVSPWMWGEMFLDSGQVYYCLLPLKRPKDGSVQKMDPDPMLHRYPPLRTSFGLGLILKIGVPIKVEYAWDIKSILGRPRTQQEKDTRIKNLVISAGYQF